MPKDLIEIILDYAKYRDPLAEFEKHLEKKQ